MENLVIISNQRVLSDITPSVNFNADSGTCWLEGESFMENSFEFYSKLTDWLVEFLTYNESIEFNIKLSYFNTTSARALTDMIAGLKIFSQQGKNVKINWYYPDPDEDDFLLDGEDIEAATGMKFNFIPYVSIQ
jgi:hypothetical protein